MSSAAAYLWVALGSALGGVARYAASLLAVRLWGPEFPWGTILINICGSFLISFFGTLTTAAGPYPTSASLRVFVMVGICGGFTTFSSFSLQTLDLARDEQWLGALANIALSVVLCLVAVTVGHLLAVRIGMAAAEP
jgi:CrcB protein